MEVIVETLLNRMLATSVQTALLVAVVWLLCRFVPRISPATQCWLWWMVALQVLLGLCADPVLLPLLPHASAAGPVLAAALDLNPLVAAVPTSAASTVAHGPSLWQTGVLVLWACGFAVMAWSTLRHWRRAGALRRNSTQCMDERVLRAVAQAAEGCGMRRAPQLRMSRSIDSPMVIGPFHPLLLLPADGSLSSEELDMAVAHELEHLRRADLWWGFLPALARHCFFFHPLVHLAVREYGIAREAACDVAVVDVGRRSRREYGELLLRLGTAESSSGLAAVSPTFKALSRRLMLLQQGSFLPRTGSMVVLLLIMVGVMPLRLVAAVAKPAVALEKVAPAKAAIESSTVSLTQPVAAVAREVRAAGTKQSVRRKQSAGPVHVAAQSGSNTQAPPVVAGGGRGDSVISKPSYVFRPDVNDYYPAASRSAGEEAIVKLRLCYDENGRVTGSTVPESAGFFRLDDAAITMGWQFRLKPGVIDGQPQAGCVVAPVRFSVTPQVADAVPATTYTGERMSVNFQDIPTRTLLQLIGDTSGRNIVISDSVSGNVTLRLNNVPWDQALDIVLFTKGLEKRVEGNVILIAPAGAFAAKDRAQ